MNRDPLIGRQFANYRIESVLGRGGMATVYYARDISLQRPVALKVIDTQFRGNTSYAERFISEARAIAQWRHENIIQVFYADKEDDLYYFVMEYIDGLDLETLLHQYADEDRLMPHPDVIRIAKALAGALDYAHVKGVIHRDVKPSNTMISGDDRVVLMDFGLALNTAQGSMGEVFGSPHYVSPEQAKSSNTATSQSDIYSMGVVLYEMLTGVVPFDDPAPTALALQHITMPPPSPRTLNPELNQATEDVLLKALAKEAADRYKTATAFVSALDTALKQAPDKLATAELPPLPPGMVAPRRSLSTQTVTERIALHVNEKATLVMPQPPRIDETQQQHPAERTKPPQAAPMPPITQAPPLTTQQQDLKSSSNRMIPIVLIGLVIVAIIGGGTLYALGFFSGNGDTPLPTEIAFNTATPETEAETVADAATETTIPTEPPVVETATSLPSNTPIPPTATPLPTSTPFIPTFTPTPLIPTVTSIPAEPTVLYPNGRVIQFIWDNNSFYWYNSAGESLSPSSIDFEALTDSGTSAGFFFDGSEWTGFRVIQANFCNALEITTEPTLRPVECKGNYNSFLTPTRTDSRGRVFWITRPNVPQFRVLWDDQEVGRCTIEIGFCEVRIP